MNSIKSIGALVLGLVLGGGAATTALLQSGFASEKRTSTLFLAGCKSGFVSGYAARNVWSVQESEIRQKLPTSPQNTVEAAIQHARMKEARDMENFKLRLAYATASSVSESHAAREMCDYAMRTTPLSPQSVDRVLEYNANPLNR